MLFLYGNQQYTKIYPVANNSFVHIFGGFIHCDANTKAVILHPKQVINFLIR